MSNKESVPVTLNPVEVKDPVPVYIDPEGLTTHVYDGPALLSDGKSLVDPMYVVETNGSPWVNKSGQLIQPIGVTNLPEPPDGDEV